MEHKPFKLNWQGQPLPHAVQNAAEELGLCFEQTGLPVYGVQGTQLRLSRSERGVELTYANLPQLCRGLGLLAEGGPQTEPIVQKPVFPALGLMLDVSRGACGSWSRRRIRLLSRNNMPAGG